LLRFRPYLGPCTQLYLALALSPRGLRACQAHQTRAPARKAAMIRRRYRRRRRTPSGRPSAAQLKRNSLPRVPLVRSPVEASLLLCWSGEKQRSGRKRIGFFFSWYAIPPCQNPKCGQLNSKFLRGCRPAVVPPWSEGIASGSLAA
jgi:hypothetical protein